MVTQNQYLRRYIRSLGPPFAVILLVLALQTAGWEESLRYDRRAILSGDWWLLITGNLVHLGWSHLWLNAAGLILIYLLYGPLLNASLWVVHGFVTCLGVGLGLLWLNPELYWYVGLSGSLHGLFIVGLLLDARKDLKFALMVFTVFAAKLLWEQFNGPLPGSEASAGGKVVVDAHLYGAISGAISYLGMWGYQWLRARTKAAD